jgi:hypothetical protein
MCKNDRFQLCLKAGGSLFLLSFAIFLIGFLAFDETASWQISMAQHLNVCWFLPLETHCKKYVLSSSHAFEHCVWVWHIDIYGEIDWLMARTACLFVSLVLLMAAARKSQECLGRCGASGGHITKLKQSIFFRYLWSGKKIKTKSWIKLATIGFYACI